MRSVKKSIALLLMLAAVTASTLALASCTGGNGDSGDTESSQKEAQTVETGEPEESTAATSVTETSAVTTSPVASVQTEASSTVPTVEYTIEIKTAGGLLPAGVNVYVYTDSDRNNLAENGFGETNEEGRVSIMLPESDTYCVSLTGLPNGYIVEDYYTFTDKLCSITVTSAVIEDENLSGVSYKLGDVMHDFTVVDTDGNTIRLSELLKTKKAVMLNFWFSTCSPCQIEFPYMQEVYERYQDDIEIVALNHYPSDDASTVKNFKKSFGLTFPVVKETNLNMQAAFGVSSYPTSILIDRYGVICLIEIGGLTSATPFEAMFSHMTADEYEQRLFTSLDELMPVEKPNIQMPSSDEISNAFDNGKLDVTYAPEPDDEYSWPFVIDSEKFGEVVIKASNSYKHSTYATMYAHVTLKKGEALALDYFASSEMGVDVMYILVDRKDIYQISGESEDWATCYPFVAVEDGTYEVAFCYFKDSDADVGDDTVYMKNFRTVSVEDVDSPTYIPRYAATHLKADNSGYSEYVEVFYNETDGYYHVGSVNGPLLLADLLGAGTPFSGDLSIYTLAYTGEIEFSEEEYELFEQYCNYASNATITGLCPVTEDLKGLLEFIAYDIGIEEDNPNEWLQMCMYYDAYGTDGVQLEDPIKGLAEFSAYEAKEGVDNEVTYDRIIMPRGKLYRFTPTRSGAYRITSNSDAEVEGWVFLPGRVEYFVDEGGERLLYLTDTEGYYNTNVSMVVYMEAGKDYYIDIAYYDVYGTGTFTFSVEFMGEDYKQFMAAAPGYFTSEDDEMADLEAAIAGGIDIALGEDGYYHEVLADGTLGSIVYADFIMSSPIFSYSIKEMIDMGGFDLTKTELDELFEYYIEEYGEEAKEVLRTEWYELATDEDDQASIDARLELFDDVVNGIYHGTVDRTDEIKTYLDKMIPNSEEHPELYGCVPVDEKLAEILQAFMDKYTFEGVEHSWKKLCYYYKNIDATMLPDAE